MAARVDAMAGRKGATLRRLARDLEELQRNPLAGVVAQPLPDNLQEWHANIAPERGHFAGLLLHLVLSFPDNYPTQPPKVRLCTGIPHSNVIPRHAGERNFICIDMLKNFFWMGGEDSSRPYEGWSTAYSVSSILLQVQCFLFDDWAHNYDGRYKNTLWDAVLEEGGHRRTPRDVRTRLQRAQEEAEAFKCKCCGHSGTRPWPHIEGRLQRVPGIQLVGDIIETAHGPGAEVSATHDDGSFDVKLGGSTTRVSWEQVVNPSGLSPPWLHVPDKEHQVPLAKPTKALAAEKVSFQADDEDDADAGASTAEGDAASETATMASSILGHSGPRRWLQWHEVHTGSELRGRVVAERPAGFLLGIGAPVKGLLPRRAAPAELALQIGAEVRVFVTAADPERWRIGLSLVAPLSQEDLQARVADGAPVRGLVVGVQPYGCFVDVGAPAAGLMHVSRFEGLSPAKLNPGVEVHVTILQVEPKLRLAGYQAPWSPPVVLKVAEAGASRATMVPHRPPPGSFARLPRPLLQVVLRGANLAGLRAVAGAERSLRAPAQEAISVFWDLQAFRCFHTRARFDDDGCVLGVGVSIVEEDGRNHLSCDFDPLSQEAFESLGVSKGVWRNEISYWLPLAVNQQHFARALPALVKTLGTLGSGRVAEQTRSSGPRAFAKPRLAPNAAIDFDAWLRRRAKASEAANARFRAAMAGDESALRSRCAQRPAAPPLSPQEALEPEVVLNVLPKLMNSQVVLLMKGEVWASHKALSGYMAFHHLLLAICRANPKVQQEVEARIGRFLSEEDERVKAKAPNLGEFICLLSASDRYSWQDAAAPLLGEVFDRHVLWLLKKHPRLGELTDEGVNQQRLKLTFESAVVSMRLIMFNVWFLNNVAKVPHAHAEGRSGSECTAASCTLARYERTCGLPPRGQVEAVHRAVTRICGISAWQEFFDDVGVERVAPQALCEWLRRSVGNSRRKGYHRAGVGQPRGGWRQPERELEEPGLREEHAALADAF